MNLDELRERWREDILRLAERHGARNVRVFGSLARGEATAASDLDLLVEMEPGRSLLDLIGFNQDLEDALGIHVDVLTEDGLSPYMQDDILHQAVAL
jgi:predicted nucleotidyltransferase